MRIRNIKDKEKIMANCDFLIQNPEDYKGKYQELFANNNPINLEIGMGKGNFIYQMAQNFPNENFIGIEKYDSVIAKAIAKMPHKLPNLYIMRYDAENLLNVFDHEINKLYLNFSDPWPKKHHHKRRLTSPNFLTIYDKIFNSFPHIIMKTDNIDLFADSVVYLSKYGYTIIDLSLDLHHKDIFNIETEYEQKFSEKGFKINYLEAVKENIQK